MHFDCWNGRGYGTDRKGNGGYTRPIRKPRPFEQLKLGLKQAGNYQFSIFMAGKRLKQSEFNAVKLLLENGVSVKKVAKSLDRCSATIWRIKTSQDFEDYRRIAASAGSTKNTEAKPLPSTDLPSQEIIRLLTEIRDLLANRKRSIFG